MKIQAHFDEIMKILGLDMTDDSLKDTPRRVAKMYVNEIFSGLETNNFPKITVIENSMQYDQMVCVIAHQVTRLSNLCTCAEAADVGASPPLYRTNASLFSASENCQGNEISGCLPIAARLISSPYLIGSPTKPPLER